MIDRQRFYIKELKRNLKKSKKLINDVEMDMALLNSIRNALNVSFRFLKRTQIIVSMSEFEDIRKKITTADADLKKRSVKLEGFQETQKRIEKELTKQEKELEYMVNKATNSKVLLFFKQPKDLKE